MTTNAALIYELVKASTDHLTADQIHRELHSRGSRMVLATVYNNLNMLCRERKLRRLTLEGQPDRFDCTDRHDHLVCAGCGRVTDLHLPDLTEELRKQIPEDFFTYDLRIQYFCDECKAKQAEGASL